ncbi:MAG: CAP domain-containing protein, partial [Solirubrobacteraceae bacterium]
MTRRLITGALGAAAALVLVPASAQARTACPAETVAPSNANSAQVSDAIFCIVNQLRAGYGLPALRRDVRLDAAATRHSQDMAARDYFSHTSPEGLTPGDRALAQGYTIGVSENIASGQGSARAVTTGWMASDGHCRNIFSAAARDIGVGTSSSAIYTQVFGDYFSAPVDPAAGNGCPYTLDLT